jgi:hypothetical protein
MLQAALNVSPPLHRAGITVVIEDDVPYVGLFVVASLASK